MTLSAPSFLAAATNAAIPPAACADVAEEAFAPPALVLVVVFVGGEQAAIPIRVTAASAATPLRRAIRGFTSDLRVGGGTHPRRLALRRPVVGIHTMSGVDERQVRAGDQTGADAAPLGGGHTGPFCAVAARRQSYRQRAQRAQVRLDLGGSVYDVPAVARTACEGPLD